MEPLPESLVASLERVEAYPLDASVGLEIERLQTHISWIFFTTDRVYKLRKAIELPFLSFATRAERNADCMREIHLNRRLTDDVYLGLAPILCHEGRWTIGAVGEDFGAPDAHGDLPEHCVVMRRLPENRDGLSLLESESLLPRHLEKTAELLAAFHARTSLVTSDICSRAEWLSRVRTPVEESIDLAAAQPCIESKSDLINRIRRGVRRRFLMSLKSFDTRRLAGHVVDGHGDLQLAHLWFEIDDRPPQVIDCVEFRDDFRILDAASEVAFLAMDLRYRGRRDLAEHFLSAYARNADDYGLYRVVDFFVSYRAIVRGAVAAVAASEAELDDAQRSAAAASAIRHLELANRALAEPARGMAIAVCGIVGSGKSTAARHIAATIGGVVIASDPVRKALAGLSPTQRGRDHPELNLYGDEHSKRVYSEILNRATAVVKSGRPVILDATFSDPAHRSQLCDWGAEHEIPIRLVETLCGEAECVRRLREREKQGLNPSDAGPAFYEVSARTFQSAHDWPGKLEIRTDEPNWRNSLAETVQSWVV
jgi:aminoglycoside phosphotransferase family enzyme/predicted kinase